MALAGEFGDARWCKTSTCSDNIVVWLMVIALSVVVVLHLQLTEQQKLNETKGHVTSKQNKSHTLHVNARRTVALAKVLVAGSLVVRVQLPSGVELRFKTWCAWTAA